MVRRNRLRPVHIASTSWFILSAGYILVLALRQAGKSWWVIVSLSGYSTLLVLLLISLYLFAIFRGVARSQKIQVEHPLTSTGYYMAFYVSTPFLGGLAGMLGMIGEARVSQFLLGIALGSLWATFSVWIVVDPAAGFLEMLLPASRKHRLERLAALRAWREEREKERKRLLAEVDEQERMEQRQWQQILEPHAEKLAELLLKGQRGYKEVEEEAVGLGVRAWQIGGLNCMRELHLMAMELCKSQNKDSSIIDYVSFWWDGIGSWRSPSVV
ncbi:MAG: hypothetical protein JSV99_10440 [Planctomycetota bacterium]|nr:MAG: hypothetical protein JSV99_10440 [Planctomycetota bacterium]